MPEYDSNSNKQVIAICVMIVMVILILVGGGVACQYSQDRKEENMCGPGYFWGTTGAFDRPTCIPLDRR